MGKAAVLAWFALVSCIGAPVAQGQTLWGYYPQRERFQGLFRQRPSRHARRRRDDGGGPPAGLGGSFNKSPPNPAGSTAAPMTPRRWPTERLRLDLLAGPNGNWQGMAGKSFSYTDRRWIFQLRDTDGFISGAAGQRQPAPVLHGRSDRG